MVEEISRMRYDGRTAHDKDLQDTLALFEAANPTPRKERERELMVFVKHLIIDDPLFGQRTIPIQSAPNLTHNRTYSVADTDQLWWRTPGESDFKRMEFKKWEILKA